MNLSFLIIFSLFFLFSVLCLVFMGILVLNGFYLKNLKKEFFSLFVLLFGFLIYSVLGLITISFNLIEISILSYLYLMILCFFYYKFFNYFVYEKYCSIWVLYVGILYILFFIIIGFYLLDNFSSNLLFGYGFIFFSFICFFYHNFTSLLIKFLEISGGYSK